MALNKKLPTSRGIDATYWRIDGANPTIDERKKTMRVALYGFVDADSTDVEPIDTRVINLSGENFVESADRTSSQDSRDWLYSAIKAMTTTDEEGETIPGEFADATEV